MTQLTGSIAIEVDLDRVADLVATRVVAELRRAARDATGSFFAGGEETYDRPADPPKTTTDADPGGYPLGGRRHPTTPEGDPS